MRALFEVVVGSIGNVYSGSNSMGVAYAKFNEYVELSKANYGRAAGEDVVLFKNDEIIKEFIGSLNKES